MEANKLPVIITPMRVDDIPHVMRIERQVFSMAWTSGIYERELVANPWSHYYVVRPTRDDLPPVLAYGGVWQMDVSAHIPTIATHLLFVRQGLGGYLLSYLLLQGARLGCVEATLEVRASNVAAQALYRSFGFEVVGRRLRYYSDNQEDALIMTLSPLDEQALGRMLRKRAQRLLHRFRVPPQAGVQHGK